MSLRFGMIADDLTGANDSGIQLKEKGLDTAVYFELPNESSAEAIVIDTDSRALQENEAYQETFKAAEFLKQHGCKHIYKKMDSTLRGYIGKELQAMENALNPEFIVIAPALPAYGRTTVRGSHQLHGEPVSDTELSMDPKHPVKESHLPTLLKNEIGEEAALITSDFLNEGVDVQEQSVRKWKENQTKYVVCDAVTTNDLYEIAKKFQRFSEKVVWAGSAGLAEVLPEVLGIEKEESVTNKHSERGPVLTVCGSLSQITQTQVGYAVDQPGIRPLLVRTEEIFSGDWSMKEEGYIEDSVRSLRNGEDVVLYVPSNIEVRERVLMEASSLGLSKLEIGKKISSALGAMTKKIVEQVKELNSLVLTGGDTAKDVAKSLGATGISLSYQMEAGIPSGHLLGIERPIQVVTKAGAFGKESSIYSAIETLRGVERVDRETSNRYHYG
ncbi:four-carbon acid sugar kinase family protein [Halobacillus salinus]|uniref:Four-carbon acid sugar kinase family protein n=1 Tax=Halobacillus salinus TaxID=192814 RepID=A0A4Z0H082_9BACI|nr:four-carbon acid sugar kinase family protein [Halobacillus salinus]TGB02443.1 four-carbon acid sugar kinase family protein [Halobacillus salinus]